MSFRSIPQLFWTNHSVDHEPIDFLCFRKALNMWILNALTLLDLNGFLWSLAFNYVLQPLWTLQTLPRYQTLILTFAPFVETYNSTKASLLVVNDLSKSFSHFEDLCYQQRKLKKSLLNLCRSERYWCSWCRTLSKIGFWSCQGAQTLNNLVTPAVCPCFTQTHWLEKSRSPRLTDIIIDHWWFHKYQRMLPPLLLDTTALLYLLCSTCCTWKHLFALIFRNFQYENKFLQPLSRPSRTLVTFMALSLLATPAIVAFEYSGNVVSFLVPFSKLWFLSFKRTNFKSRCQCDSLDLFVSDSSFQELESLRVWVIPQCFSLSSCAGVSFWNSSSW